MKVGNLVLLPNKDFHASKQAIASDGSIQHFAIFHERTWDYFG